MIFVFKKWESFCKELAQKNMRSVCASDVAEGRAGGRYIILKHDVETNVSRAYEMAKIEHHYGHRGSYYVQAYLMDDGKNILLLQDMQKMGHEISYHYDVMDACRGNLDNAIQTYEENAALFEQNGFHLRTVCQHGNPVIERKGYTSNRDFFRSDKVQALFPQVSDVMVDFARKARTRFLYFSDAGRRFQLIHDPMNNDIINSDDKNILFQDLNALSRYLDGAEESAIISTHPHRWMRSPVSYMARNMAFRAARLAAKLLLHVPGAKKIMSRYYYLAKKL